MTYQPEHDATPPFHQQIQGRERCKDRMNESYAFLPVAHQGSHIVINTRVIESITPPSSADPPDRYGVTYRIGDRLRFGFATTVDLIKAGVRRPRRRGDGHRCRIMEGKSVKFNKYYICVTDLRDEQILVHTRDVVLILPPTLFGSFNMPGYYEDRYEVMYRRDGGLWHGRAESDALIAAGLELPALPPWIALADVLWRYAQTRTAGGEADWLVPIIERYVKQAGGEAATDLLNRAYLGDGFAAIHLVWLIFRNTARESSSAGRS